MKRIVLFWALAAPSACVGTSLEADRHDPANPNAPTPAISEPPPTLQKGFDPEGTAVPAEAPGAHDHEQHQHDQHQHHQHSPPATEADAGAR